MLESYTVGATCWAGGRTGGRADGRTDVEHLEQQSGVGGKDVVGATGHPMLLVAPAHNRQVPPEGVSERYDDLRSSSKVLLDLACSSHKAMWEMNKHILFDAFEE